jgi:hypothetical protein
MNATRAAILLAALTTCSLPAATPTASATPPPSILTTRTSAEVLHLDGVNVAGLLSVADVGLGASSGQVSAVDTPRSTATAKNLDASALDLPLNLLSSAQRTAPPASLQPDTATSAGGSVPGLLSVGLSQSVADARWGTQSACPTSGTLLSSSRVSTADVSTVSAPTVGTLLSLPNTVSSSQSAELVPNGRPYGGRDVLATTTGSTALLRLLDGQVTVGVTDAPVLTARASGTAGGAQVSWQAPAVSVKVGGETSQLPADGTPLEIASPDNPLVHVQLSAGQVENTVQTQDGQRASASASVLHLSITLLGAEILGADLFPLSVVATAPAGGIACGTNATDTDGDGLTDAQESTGSENDHYANRPTDPMKADTDGDGLDDGAEIQRGTDPWDPDTDDGGVADGTEVDRGTDPLQAADDATRPVPVIDADGDGLSLVDEVASGTDPTNPDTDGDGLKDGAEVNTHQTDPNNPDTDGDGLTDGREVNTTRTNPTKADTDADGLTDGREVNTTRTNPTKADTDADGLTDGREVLQVATKKYKRCHTSPVRRDTDKDGLTDGAEILRWRTNPCDWDTDHGGFSDGREIKAGSDPLNPRSSPRHPHRR